MLSDEVNKNAEIVFAYLKINEEFDEKADLIMAFASSSLASARYAAKLYRQGLAPKVLFSGGETHYRNPVLAKTNFKTEAEWFKNEAIHCGVDPEDIVLEKKAGNSSENIKFSYQKLKELNIKTEKIIFTQKPYMMRRVLASLQKQWPDKSTIFIPMCEDITFKQFSYQLPEELITVHLNTMVGDLQRVIEYSKTKYNYQTEQEVPKEVYKAYLSLVDAGYDKRLL
jgi:uncharacterized SAM-binding protein YcdF (DUF218 family)